MKMIAMTSIVKQERQLLVCVDVCAASLDVHARVERADGQCFALIDQWANRTGPIRAGLAEVLAVARTHGYAQLKVACEATGSYEQGLLREARQMGCAVAYVSGEAVAKARVIESNDSGKTDTKDPRVIRVVAEQKCLVARELPPGYAQLRELNRIFEQEGGLVAQLKNQLQAQIRRQFPDLRRLPDLLDKRLAEVLAEEYAWNPHRIVADTWEQFVQRVKGRLPRTRWEVLEHVYADAKSSALHLVAEADVALGEQRVRELWADYQQHLERKEGYRQQRVAVYQTLPEAAKLAPLGLSASLLAGVIAETGPLRDFGNARQLLRYAGLNLRERSSGTYKGKVRLSKKGRAPLRQALYKLVMFGMSGSHGMWNQLLQEKKKELANGLKAVVLLMRKALRMLFGLAKSTAAFDPRRIPQAKAA